MPLSSQAYDRVLLPRDALATRNVIEFPKTRREACQTTYNFRGVKTFHARVEWREGGKGGEEEEEAEKKQKRESRNYTVHKLLPQITYARQTYRTESTLPGPSATIDRAIITGGGEERAGR